MTFTLSSVATSVILISFPTEKWSSPIIVFIGGGSKQKPHPPGTRSQEHVSDGSEAESGGEGATKRSMTHVYSSGSESDMSDSDAADQSVKWVL